jgi:hypothetical protein
MKAPAYDINAANDFELKGILLSLIGKAKRKQLIRVFEVLKEPAETVEDIETTPYALTPEQEAELAIAVEETYHEENLISHEEALNQLSRWLTK